MHLWQQIQKISGQSVRAANLRFNSQAKVQLRQLEPQIEELKNKAAPQKIVTIMEKTGVFYGFTQQQKEVKTEERIDQQAVKQLHEAQKLRQQLQQQQQEIVAVDNEKRQFKKVLSKAGIKPLAVLPSAMFNALCQHFNLYRFEHLSESGLTYGKYFDISQLADIFMILLYWLPVPIGMFLFAKQPNWQLPGAFISSAGVLGMFFFYDYYECSRLGKILFWISFLTGYLGFALYAYPFRASILNANISQALNILAYLSAVVVLYVVVSIVWLIATALIGYSSTTETLRGEKLIQFLLRSISSAYIKHSSQSKLLKRFFPDKTDYRLHNEENLMPVKIRFAQTDKHFLAVLRKLYQKNFKPLIAAQPEAIVLDKGQTTVKINQRIQELVNFDPILYVRSTKGNYVAVVAQSGNFSDELKVVDWVQQEGIQQLNFN